MDAPRLLRRAPDATEQHNAARQRAGLAPLFFERYVPSTDVPPVRLHPRTTPPIPNARTQILNRASRNGTPIYTVRIDPYGPPYAEAEEVEVELGAITDFVSPQELEAFEQDMFLHPEKDPDVPKEEEELPPAKKAAKPAKRRVEIPGLPDRLEDVDTDTVEEKAKPLERRPAATMRKLVTETVLKKAELLARRPAAMMLKPALDTSADDSTPGPRKEIADTDSELDELSGDWEAHNGVGLNGASSRFTKPDASSVARRLSAVVVPGPSTTTSGSASKSTTRSASPAKRQKPATLLSRPPAAPLSIPSRPATQTASPAKRQTSVVVPRPSAAPSATTSSSATRTASPAKRQNSAVVVSPLLAAPSGSASKSATRTASPAKRQKTSHQQSGSIGLPGRFAALRARQLAAPDVPSRPLAPPVRATSSESSASSASSSSESDVDLIQSFAPRAQPNGSGQRRLHEYFPRTSRHTQRSESPEDPAAAQIIREASVRPVSSAQPSSSRTSARQTPAQRTRPAAAHIKGEASARSISSAQPSSIPKSARPTPGQSTRPVAARSKRVGSARSIAFARPPPIRPSNRQALALLTGGSLRPSTNNTHGIQGKGKSKAEPPSPLPPPRTQPHEDKSSSAPASSSSVTPRPKDKGKAKTPALPRAIPPPQSQNPRASRSNNADADAASDSDTGPNYEIEAILKDKPFGGMRYYFVKWLGYPVSDEKSDLDCWLPENHLAGVKDLLDEYKAKRKTVWSYEGNIGFLPGYRRKFESESGEERMGD